jgi:hypothetical protein
VEEHELIKARLPQTNWNCNGSFLRYNNLQHNGLQHNNTLHNDSQHEDTQRDNKKCCAKNNCHSVQDKKHYIFINVLSDKVLNTPMLSDVLLNAIL